MTFNCRNIPLISTTVPSVKVKCLYFQYTYREYESLKNENKNVSLKTTTSQFQTGLTFLSLATRPQRNQKLYKCGH